MGVEVRVRVGVEVRVRVRSRVSTSTKELMMESQWISKLCGRNEYCAYLARGEG